MTEHAPVQKITVEVRGQKIVLDPANMRYNENSIGEYMNREYGWIDYFGKQIEFAQKDLAVAKNYAEFLQNKRFLEAKDKGFTDSTAKAYSIADDDVVKAKDKIAELKETVGHIKAHLNAWKENHDNVQNRGHTLRKEMEVLNRDVYSTPADMSTGSFEDYLEQK